MPTKREHLYLTTEVDVLAGGKPEKPGDPLPVKRVGPGLLSEVEDLTEAHIKKLPRGVVRPATADEIEAGQQRALSAKVREVAAQTAEEQRGNEIERENETKKAVADAERAKAKEVAALEAEHETARAKERERAAKEINEAAGIKPAGKK